MLAADYPFLDVFWTMLIFFLWITWFVVLFRVVADVFRRGDIGGWPKTAWLVFVIVLPFLGVFVYVVAQGRKMGERDLRQAEESRRQLDDYVRNVSGGAAAEIERAKALLDSGAITQPEFDAIKARALA